MTLVKYRRWGFAVLVVFRWIAVRDFGMCEGEGRAVVREKTRRLFLPRGGPGRIFSLRVRLRLVLSAGLSSAPPGAGWRARRANRRSSWF